VYGSGSIRLRRIDVGFLLDKRSNGGFVASHRGVSGIGASGANRETRDQHQ
jgi:hypothetical protein